MKFKIIFCLFLSIHLGVNAQMESILNIPSPEVSNLGMYGVIPVGLYSGVPDVTIPLYEIKTGNFTMPITANYHIGSVKPNKTPGPLGLGWSLSAGGYITRTVRGYIDEQAKNGRMIGYFGHHQKMKNITGKNFDEQLMNCVDKTSQYLEDKEYYDLAADEFHFDVCGYSGTFYMNEDGGWTVVSESDIKVEFDPNNGFASLDDFIKRNTKQGVDPNYPNDLRRPYLSSWGRKAWNDRFIKSFTLIAPDGTRFEFGGIRATEFCISYYNRNSSDLIACSWRLSKITTLDGYSICFDYSPSPLICDIEYKPYKEYIKTPNSTTVTQINGTKELGFEGFINHPVILERITTPNETIQCTYSSDTCYQYRINTNICGYPLFWSRSYRWGQTEEERKRLEDKCLNFALTLPPVGIFENNRMESISAISKIMQNYLLHRIAITKNGGIRNLSLYFDYTKTGRDKLSHIYICDDKPELRYTIHEYNPNGYLIKRDTIYQLPLFDEFNIKHNVMHYSFEYDPKEMEYQYIISETDSWGYWNGNRISSLPKFEIIKPNLNATKAETLYRIQYPTGGSSIFEYELNNYSRVVDSVSHLNLVNECGQAGGLRVKSIKNIDRNNNFISKKIYYYSKDHRDSNSENSSGICCAMPVFSAKYVYNADIYKQRLTSQSIYAPSTNINTPNVGYSWIIEESVDSLGNSLGNIRYNYSNFDTDINGNSHFDESCIYSSVPHNSSVPGHTPYTSISFERGKLLSKEYRDKNDVIYKKETYNYQRTENTPIVTAHFTPFSISFKYGSNVVPYFSCVGWLTNTHVASYLIDSVSVYLLSNNNDLVLFDSKRYSYNSKKMLKRESYINSDALMQSVDYYYPDDISRYNWLSNDFHITNPIIKKTINCGSKSSSEIVEYSTNYISHNAFACKKTIDFGNNDRKEMYNIEVVDQYNKPIAIEIDGIRNVLIWGHHGQRIIVRIEDAPEDLYKELVYHYNHLFCCSDNIPENETFENIINEYINKHKDLLMIYNYTYNDDLQLESKISPNGVSIFYSYDNFGRLCQIYRKNGNKKEVINEYNYQYFNDIIP